MLSESPLGCLAGALLAGGFLGGTLTRVVEVLVSFPPLFLTWAKLHSFNHSLPSPFFLNCSFTERTEPLGHQHQCWGLLAMMGSSGGEPAGRVEYTPTVWHNPVKQWHLLGFTLWHFLLLVPKD